MQTRNGLSSSHILKPVYPGSSPALPVTSNRALEPQRIRARRWTSPSVDPIVTVPHGVWAARLIVGHSSSSNTTENPGDAPMTVVLALFLP